jgi:hypothetical protein
LLDDVSHDIVLQPNGTELTTGLRLLVLQVRFFQELNGELYPLRQESAGAMAVIGAWSL